MSLTKTVGLFAGTTLAITGAAFGSTDVNAQIADLQAQIAQLKSSQGDQWLTEQRAAEIRGIVTDVLADAQTRSSLQGSGAGAGYDGGFFMSSADGNYSMKVNVLQQIRWSFNDNDSDQSFGFENKRTRFTFSGNMVDSSWSYKVGYYFGSTAADFSANELSDANVTKDLGNGLSMTVGQFKLPFSAEYGIDAGNLQFTDYSVSNTLLGTGYGQGLMFGYSADAFRVMGAYVNAINQVNEAWTDGSPDTDWAFAFRGEFKVAGNWGQFSDAQSWKGEEFGAVIGLGYAAQRDDSSDDTPSQFTLDGTVDFGGANVTAAYYMTDDDNGNETSAFTLAGGVFVSDDFELVARYENIDVDGGPELGTITLGGNWYLAKNTAKAQFDFGYAFDAIFTDAAEYANWTESTEDGEWVVRAQMSFSF
ncbi:MAG: porin [Planctomycetota bacterium]